MRRCNKNFNLYPLRKENRPMKTNLRKAFSTMVATLGLGLLVLGTTTVQATDTCFLGAFGRTLVCKQFSSAPDGTHNACTGNGLCASRLMADTARGTSEHDRIAYHLDTSCPFTP